MLFYTFNPSNTTLLSLKLRGKLCAGTVEVVHIHSSGAGSISAVYLHTCFWRSTRSSSEKSVFQESFRSLSGSLQNGSRDSDLTQLQLYDLDGPKWICSQHGPLMLGSFLWQQTRNIRNEAGERTNQSGFVQGKQSLGQEPVLVGCLDVVMQTKCLAWGDLFPLWMKEGVGVVSMVMWSS